jgi:hypothetical protein
VVTRREYCWCDLWVPSRVIGKRQAILTEFCLNRVLPVDPACLTLYQQERDTLRIIALDGGWTISTSEPS